MSLPVEIVAACWAIFLLVWTVFSFTAKASRGPRRSDVLRVIRFALLVGIGSAIANFIARGRLSFALPEHPSAALAWLGAACAVLGISLAVWSRVTLGRNWGMPATLRAEPELVTSGPYALVRHPIYTGILLAMVGSALAGSAALFMVAAVLAIHFVTSALIEERDMRAQFPNTYPAYAARTKMLIPYVL
jgi:protein-S-isoprenylcysteine O-methyltransferase Ste14